MEHTRDTISGEITLDYFVRKAAEGWKLSAIEWVRDSAETRATNPQSAWSGLETALPYGLRFVSPSAPLEENPLEMTVLFLILDQIVKEKRMSEIAALLNQSGHRTREGHEWSPTAVFNLLPRLIEVGPALLKSQSWRERRARVPDSPPN